MTKIKLYNTKTRSKEDFTPLDANDVRMYVCGPTVYDRAHIGNARPVIVFDVLYRLLREVYGAEHVQYARNFTDVDDKINATAAVRKAAGAAGTLEELIQERTDETIAWYLEDMGALGNLKPDHAPRATQYIQEMVDMSAKLIEAGHAYEAEGHVLFDVTSYAEYGSLSGRSVDDMIAGARVEVAPYKRNPMDFVLWKPSDDEQPGWDSPWGRGRPGWHIECSAMAEKLYGKRFDIHGGGLDLAFPHHENEKAQSCACGSEDDFAQVWMHNEMLQVEGKKMSKSLGNFFSVRDLLDQGYSGAVIRFVFLMTHYSKPMDWTETKATEAKQHLFAWRKLLRDGLNVALTKEDYLTLVDEEIVAALSSDLNTSQALKRLKDLFVEAKTSAINSELMKRFAVNVKFLGFSEFSFRDTSLPVAIDKAWVEATLQQFKEKLVELRADAMSSKDYSKLDTLKSGLVEAGVEVRMSKDSVDLSEGPNFDGSKLKALL